LIHFYKRFIMERWEGRVALVTGASVGIGALLVKDLVKAGLKVVSCARRLKPMEELRDSLAQEKGKVYPIKCDLASAEDIMAMFKEIETNKELGRIDICVNNAGLSHKEPLLQLPADHVRQMIDVNVLGANLCIQQSILLMRKLNIDDGQIININSNGGHRVFPAPGIRFYCATKIALTALTRAWREELRGLNSRIRVCQISPGFVEDTDFFSSMMIGVDMSKLPELPPGLKASDIVDSAMYVLSTPAHMEVNDVILRATESDVHTGI
jgi:NADP-dependent 3-hydroxy acid dehydrogenase YdfG